MTTPFVRAKVSIDIFTNRWAGSRALARRLARGLGSAGSVNLIELSGRVSPTVNSMRILNKALRASKADYLAFMNGPVFLPDKALTRLSGYFSRGAALAAVGAADQDAAHAKEIVLSAGSFYGAGSRSFLPSRFWLLDRRAFRQAGFLDERFYLRGFAFLDYGFRLRQLGLRLFTATDVVACHVSGVKTSAGAAPPKRLARDLELLKKKWCGGGIGAILSLIGRRELKLLKINTEVPSFERCAAEVVSPEIPRAVAPAPDFADLPQQLQKLEAALREEMVRTSDYRRDRLSREFWEMAKQLAELREEIRQIALQQKGLMTLQNGVKILGGAEKNHPLTSEFAAFRKAR